MVRVVRGLQDPGWSEYRGLLLDVWLDGFRFRLGWMNGAIDLIVCLTGR